MSFRTAFAYSTTLLPSPRMKVLPNCKVNPVHSSEAADFYALSTPSTDDSSAYSEAALSLVGCKKQAAKQTFKHRRIRYAEAIE